MRHIFSWLSIKLKTDVKYLVEGGFWLSLGQGFRMISGLILLVLFANFLPKETYGTYQFIMSAAAVLGAFTLSGMGPAITRATAQGDDGALRYGFRTKLTWSIGIVLASGAVSIYYFLSDQHVLAVSFLIIGSLLPLFESFGLYRFYLRGRQQFRESELLGFWRQLIPLVTMAITLLSTTDTILLVATYFISNTLAVGIVYIQVIRKYKLLSKKNSDMLNLSKHLSFLDIIGMTASHLDKLLLFHFLGPVPTATYILAQNPITRIRKSLSILTEMTIPKLSKRNFTELQKTLPRKVGIFVLIISIITLTYILAAPFLFSVFFPKYPESVLLTQAMALILLFYPRSIYGQAFKAHALKREMYISRICTPLLTIILLLILLPQYGIWGAIFANLISQGIANFFLWYLFIKASVKKST